MHKGIQSDSMQYFPVFIQLVGFKLWSIQLKAIIWQI